MSVNESLRRQNLLENKNAGHNSGSAQQAVQLFRRFDKKSLDGFMKGALSRHFLPGQFICRQGESATSLHLITCGVVKVYGSSSSGLDALFEWRHPGDVVGLGALVSPPGSYLWNAEAIEPTQTLSWTFKSTRTLGERKDALYENALSIALQWAQSLQERFQELATEKVEQRIAHLILYLSVQLRERDDGTLDLNISNEDLAQMAGTNPYTVNRILNQWERSGHIEKGRKRLRVCNEESIVKISNSREVSE